MVKVVYREGVEVVREILYFRTNPLGLYSQDITCEVSELLIGFTGPRAVPRAKYCATPTVPRFQLCRQIPLMIHMESLLGHPRLCHDRHPMIRSHVIPLQKWRVYLEGRPFVVFTDHATLQHFPDQPKLSRRQARWMERMQEYDFVIKYLPGKQNV